MKITQQDIGRKVIYQPYHGDTEEGVITSFNSLYVFVRYGSQCTSQATCIGQVSFV